MAAVAQRLDRPRVRMRPPLRLVPNPRRTQARRDGLYAATLATLLAAGIVVVLLLNTATQTQADAIAATKQRLGRLSLQLQTLHVDLDRAGVPAVLAVRARALNMHPASQLPVLTLPRHPVVTLPTPKVRPHHLSARARAGLRGHAG